MKRIKKTLALLLVFCMFFSMAPTAFAKEADTETEMSADEVVLDENDTESAETEIEDTAAENKETETEDSTEQSEETDTQSDEVSVQTDDVTMATINKQQSVPLNTDEMYKIYHLDCGRKYFSVEQIKAVIDTIAANDYNTLELAVGNDGLRLLLDDMSVEANGTTYSSEDVKAGIQEGNRKYYDAGTNELTQTEMDEIFTYAGSKGISIIPMINSPGHMDAILSAASSVIGEDCSYNGSVRTIDVTNAKAVNFTLALLDKYIQYFQEKGCTVFNMGCDEYANDIYPDGSMGFGNLVSEGKYGAFVNYVNNLAAQVQNAGMTAMAFNDGFYFNGNTSSGTFDTDIAIAFWSSGWGNYKSMSASDLASRGHKIINTHGDWYYIVGVSDIDSVTANINSIPYNSVMGSGEMDVAGCMLCSWCDTPENSYDETESANLEDQISTFAAANSSVFSVDQQTGPSNAPENTTTKTDTITVTAGSTASKTVEGANYAGEYTTEDPDVATVTVTGRDEVASSESYSAANNVTCNTLIDSDSDEWVETGYYYRASDGNYYPLYAQRDSEWNWSWSGGYYTYTYTWGYSATDSPSDMTTIGTQKSRNTNGRPDFTVYTRTETAGTPASTTITVTAAADAAGSTTYVNIGDTRYTINVIAEDLSRVEDLTIEYWITNGRPTDDDGNTEVNVKAEDAYLEDGIAVEGIAPDNTTKENRTLQYWRSRLLDTTLRNNSTSGREEQTEEAGDDETYNGVEFTKVRYWNSTWAVYTENDEWVEIESNHQLVAYYLEILPVSDELMVNAADWGKKGDGSTSGDYLDPSSSCTVSVQVVYEDGTTNPATTTAADLRSCTIAYGYWDGGRGIGTLNLNGLEGYQIWKVEAETGSETYDRSSDTWGSYTVSSFTWDNNPVTVYEGDPVDSYTIHNDANNPDSTGYYSNLMWDENHEAILIKVYVRQKPAEDNLKVIYYDERFGDELYNYDINVPDGTDFSDITPTPGAFEGNPDRIDVRGCGIENIFEVTQYFETDLTQVPEAVGKYNSELYEYTGSVISEDNRTLYLYYNINTEVLSPMFVADYGRPFTFSLSDVVTEDNVQLVQNVSVNTNTRYGTLAYDAGAHTFTYTPTQVLPNIDVLTIHITFDGSDSAVTTNAGVMPATTVNYEEGFATLSGFTGGSRGTAYQAAQIAGQSSDEYGYDANVSEENNNAAVSTTKGSTAELSFTGTGVDLYVNSTGESGNIAIQVRDDAGRLVKIVTVKTTSNSTITDSFSRTEQDGLIAASVQGLAYGSYTVKVTTLSDAEVYFDGFRVYGTLQDQSNDYYIADKEDEPTFLELRDYVLTAMDVTNESSAEVYAQAREQTDGQLNGVVLSQEGVTSYTAQELLDNGPKNELFLLPGQSVVFKVTTGREIQVGLKAVNGSASVSGSYNGTISTDKDMLYTVANASESSTDKTITITNASTSSSILSVTKVKICDDPKAAFAELSENDFSEALTSLGITEEPSEPEVTYADASLNIVLNNADGNELASTGLTANGTVGGTHTFAAADIQAAAEEILPDGYELTGEAADVEVVYGESESVEFNASEAEAEEPEGNGGDSFLNNLGNAIKNVINTVTGFFQSLFRW